MKFAFATTLVLALVSFANAQDLVKPLEPSPFCQKGGFLAADGTQNKDIDAKVCVSLEIGQLPAINKMVSCIITNPKFGQVIKRNVPFTVNVKVINLETGFFSDPNVDYYQVPQTLNRGGVIQGHSHVTIQKLAGNYVPDPTVFAFFKGLNDPAVNGVLSVNVTKGLPSKGIHRICTMNSAFTHQPVVMPVAQRGAQDDCVRVFVQ